MKTIIAIGGGEIRKSEISIGTYKIDSEIIRLSNKNKPRLLFIPTASKDSEEYCNTIRDYFGKKHNCEIDYLFLVKKRPKFDAIQNKILSADIIYVGGGDSSFLLSVWCKYNLKSLFEKALEKGIILSGISAGALCWFEQGISEKFGKMQKLNGLGFIKGVFCPHFNKKKRNALKELLDKDEILFASDDNSALIFQNTNFKTYSSDNNANSWIAHYRNDQLIFNKLSFIDEKIKRGGS